MSPLDCWWSHINSTTHSASSKHRVVIAKTPKSTQLKTETQRPWHSSHYPGVGEKLLIKEGNTKEKHTGKRMPRLPPLAVLSGPYEASQKWRPSWHSTGSLWSVGLSKYLLIRLSSAWLSPKEGGSESFLKDEKHSVSAASSTSVYTRGRFPLLNHFFWWLNVSAITYTC